MIHPTNFIHYLETPATLAGVINVYLAARTNVWNFLFGVITVTLFGIIFWQAKLYADMSLQIVYLFLQFYGLYQWLYGSARHTPLPVSSASKTIYFIAGLATAILFISYAYILKHYTDSTTVYIDSFTTALSLVAQWMMSKKWYENWLLWIVVNVISIKMYIIKQLYLTSGLYFIFFIICCFAYYNWKKQINSHV